MLQNSRCCFHPHSLGYWLPQFFGKYCLPGSCLRHKEGILNIWVYSVKGVMISSEPFTLFPTFMTWKLFWNLFTAKFSPWLLSNHQFFSIFHFLRIFKAFISFHGWSLTHSFQRLLFFLCIHFYWLSGMGRGKEIFYLIQSCIHFSSCELWIPMANVALKRNKFPTLLIWFTTQVTFLLVLFPLEILYQNYQQIWYRYPFRVHLSHL